MDVGLINHLRFDRVSWTCFLAVELTHFARNQRSVLTGLCVKSSPFLSVRSAAHNTFPRERLGSETIKHTLQTRLIPLLKYIRCLYFFMNYTLINFLIFWNAYVFNSSISTANKRWEIKRGKGESTWPVGKQVILQVVPEPQRSVSHLTLKTTHTGKLPLCATARRRANRCSELAETTVADRAHRSFRALLTRSALNKINKIK